jgi:isopentenyl-diphosphate delta-isomerase
LTDPTAEDRKSDHIKLAFESQVKDFRKDPRFHFEPALGTHHVPIEPLRFLGKNINLPLWISSMTGGTAQAGKINRNLAEACKEFKIGMGLGSCRSLLYNSDHFNDFNLRPIIGDTLPFFANLGIAQVETLLQENKGRLITELVKKLEADGLIIHLNPLQEFLQPEGDRYAFPPIETIQKLLDIVSFPLIIKEVGQGMGPESMQALLHLPIAALDFGAYGGTNFSRLELLRSAEEKSSAYHALTYIGHTAEEMTDFLIEIVNTAGGDLPCKQIIISGGLRNFLDGYYFTSRVETGTGGKMLAIYAQGSAFLKHARESYDALRNYIITQKEGLALCKGFLKVKK